MARRGSGGVVGCSNVSVQMKTTRGVWAHNIGAPKHHLLFFCLFHYIVLVISSVCEISQNATEW